MSAHESLLQRVESWKELLLLETMTGLYSLTEAQRRGLVADLTELKSLVVLEPEQETSYEIQRSEDIANYWKQQDV